MSKAILMILLGAINASCWWSIFTGNVHPTIMVPTILVTAITTVVCITIIAIETLGVLDEPPKK